MDIEERAYRHYPIEKQKSNDIVEAERSEAGFDGYILGAREQKKIDIEKSCEEFCKCMGCGQYESCKEANDWCVPRMNFEKAMKS